jgi:hypothetical protein
MAVDTQTTQERIKENIQRFDIYALLKLLESLGYKAADIYFQSNPSLSSSSSICHDISFFEKEYPRIILTLNMGFFSNQSSLPSFFRKKMDEGSIDPVSFSKYLGFFDHYIIKTFLSMSMPEDNGWFFSDWKETIRHYLKFLALNSVSTLALLFQLCFPELRVAVMKFPRVISLQSSSITLGTTLLGKDSFLQKKKQLTISSLRVLLTTEEHLTELSVPWAFEIKKRMADLIFPLLEKINIYLQVDLIVEKVKESAHLSKTTHLGYCSIGIGSKPVKFTIFSDYSNLSRH